MIQENELKQILSADLRPSVIIDAKIEEAYNRIRSTEIPLTSNKNLLVRRIMVGMGKCCGSACIDGYILCYESCAGKRDTNCRRYF